MSEKLKTYTFLQQLEQGYIRIPRIQRGYAQGRRTKKVDDIRKNFLHSLFQVIRGRRQATELDFVYGSMNREAFEPLDGQQRLTTLFLIHWMLGINLTRKDSDKHSAFTYASCPTSEDFSNTLVTHDAISLINEALDSRAKDGKAQNKNCTPSQLITKRDWFHWEWKFDPSISSMLVMIDSIFAEIVSEKDWQDNLDKYRANLNNITFNSLNLGDFGLSNELFIKMNARGKQLSEFDKVKSTLEEELQIQQTEFSADTEPIATQQIEAEWRTLMDGRWSDYFWHNFARDLITSTSDAEPAERKHIRLTAAKACEVQFKKLLLRLIQLQLHAKKPASDALCEACYRRNATDIDNLLIAYSDSLLAFRNQETKTVGQTETMIDFAGLIRQINNLFITAEDGTVSDIFRLLTPDTFIDNNGVNLMQSFLEDTLPNDVALTFFAALQFLENYPYSTKAEWINNFSQWVKSLRNILSNNNNNQRIDKRWRYEAALKAIQEMTADLASFGQSNNITAEDRNFVHKFFDSIQTKSYTILENQAIKEEYDKAAFILADASWQDAIAAAERDSYLWGQIRALIEWSEGDIERFRNYASKLAQILGIIHSSPNKYYLAALTLDPTGWKTSNRLFQLNFDRDNSFKRLLRDFDKDASTYAPLIKRMIDLWITTANEDSADKFLDNIIVGAEDHTPVWLECMLRQPSILEFSYHKRIYEDNGHVVLAQLKTMDSHCIDPVLKYLQAVATQNGKAENVVLEDSKGTPHHSISYSTHEGTYTLRWSDEPGKYRITSLDGTSQTLSPQEAIATFSKLLD